MLPNGSDTIIPVMTYGQMMETLPGDLNREMKTSLFTDNETIPT
jgi:hypothetical protein